jgi:8-amino-7-oxononanoate synthase
MVGALRGAGGCAVTAGDGADRGAILRSILAARGGGGTRPNGGGRLEESVEVGRFFERLAALESAGGVDPCFRVIGACGPGRVEIGGRWLLDFSRYNYLGLAGDERVKRAAQAAIDLYGTSASASRLAVGERPVHGELERELADFLGVESALVFTAGYAANAAVLGHVVGPGDLVVHDEQAHHSILAGCQLAGARRLAFPHNDLGALDRLLARNRADAARVLVVVEGAYSMEGDLADLGRLVELRRRHGVALCVDEAHSIGVVGETGRGVGEWFGVDRGEVDLWMGTLSKALAGVGGYVAGSERMIRYLRYTTPGFIFSAGMTPADAAAARAALGVVREEPWRVERLRANARRFGEAARAAGLDTGRSGGAAVIPVWLGETVRCLRVAARLFEEGMHVFPMTYPAVPEGQGRLRFFVGADHEPADLDRAAATVGRLVGEAG